VGDTVTTEDRASQRNGLHCVYCKQPSHQSRSAEHVIPESLGNDSLVLPPGVVCDGCNNYFSREVEAPFLNAPLLQMLRFDQMLPSKRGRVPPMVVSSLQMGRGEVRRYSNGDPSTIAFEPSEVFDESLRNRTPFVTYTLMTPPSDSVTSRFLGKVAIGYIAHRLLSDGKDTDILVQDDGLDRLRDHARRGTDLEWPISVRSIYSPDRLWRDESGRSQIVTEVDLFEDKDDEPYLVLAVFGTELVIALCEPRISGFERWLANNGDQSPLYVGSYAEDLLTASEPTEMYPRPGWSLARG